MKKTYHSPLALELQAELQTIIAASKFQDPTASNPQDEQTLTPTNDPYSGEFHSRRNDNWDDEDIEMW